MTPLIVFPVCGLQSTVCIHVTVGRTALIMSFSWDDPKTEPAHWAELLMQRTVPSPRKKGERVLLSMIRIDSICSHLCHVQLTDQSLGDE